MRDADYQRELRAAENQARRTANPPSAGGCWKWTVGLLALPAMLLLALFIWSQVAPAPADGRVDFIVSCQAAVRDRLKAPSTADFGPETSRDVQGSPGSYRLTGTVEAQNALGVPLRTAYSCTGSANAPSVGIF